MLVKTPVKDVEQISIIKAINFSLDSYKKGKIANSKTAQIYFEQNPEDQFLLEIVVDDNVIWDDSMAAEDIHDDLLESLNQDEAEAVENLICIMKLSII